MSDDPVLQDALVQTEFLLIGTTPRKDQEEFRHREVETRAKTAAPGWDPDLDRARMKIISKGAITVVVIEIDYQTSHLMDLSSTECHRHQCIQFADDSETRDLGKTAEDHHISIEQ